VHDSTENVAMLMTVILDPASAIGDLSSCEEQGDGQAALHELCLHAGSVLRLLLASFRRWKIIDDLSERQGLDGELTC